MTANCYLAPILDNIENCHTEYHLNFAPSENRQVLQGEHNVMKFASLPTLASGENAIDSS